MKWWEKNFLFNELTLSIIIVVTAWVIVNHFGLVNTICSILNNSRLQLYGTIASVTGALLGFIIAGMSILLTMGESESLNILRKSKHYFLIFKVYLSCSKYLALTTILAIVGLIVDKDGAPIIWFTALVCWALLISIFRLLRCMWILEKMVGLSVKSQ